MREREREREMERKGKGEGRGGRGEAGEGEGEKRRGKLNGAEKHDWYSQLCGLTHTNKFAIHVV